MSTFSEFQAQKDAEDANDNDPNGILILLMIIVSFTILLLFAILFGNGEETIEACEDVGGTYQVVGEEFSAALKQTVDIYGCVK